MNIEDGTTVVNGHTISTCPGAIVATEVSSTKGVYCCVEKDKATVTASMCAGFPFCSDSTAVGMTIATPACLAFVPVTASNYNELLASATAGTSESHSDSHSTSATATPASAATSSHAAAAATSSAAAGNGANAASDLSWPAGMVSMVFGAVTLIFAVAL